MWSSNEGKTTEKTENLSLYMISLNPECEPAAPVTRDEGVNEAHLEDQRGSERSKPTDSVYLHLGTA